MKRLLIFSPVAQKVQKSWKSTAPFLTSRFHYHQDGDTETKRRAVEQAEEEDFGNSMRGQVDPTAISFHQLGWSSNLTISEFQKSTLRILKSAIVHLTPQDLNLLSLSHSTVAVMALEHN